MEPLSPLFLSLAFRAWWCSFRLFFRFFRFVRLLESGEALERALGFRHNVFHVPGDRSAPYNKVVIKSVERGGEFETAGFRAGDILSDLGGFGLYGFLIAHRGQMVELAAVNIAVVANGDGPFEEIPPRMVTFAVPQ